MIRVRYSSVDRCRSSRRFKTLAGAQKFTHYRIGAHPEIGRTYAVSGDGVGKITVEGCTLAELFPAEEGSHFFPFADRPLIEQAMMIEMEMEEVSRPLTIREHAILEVASLRVPLYGPWRACWHGDPARWTYLGDGIPF